MAVSNRDLGSLVTQLTIDIAIQQTIPWFSQKTNGSMAWFKVQQELCPPQVFRGREGRIEGWEACSKAICSCVITALGFSWL